MKCLERKKKRNTKLNTFYDEIALKHWEQDKHKN